MLQQQTVSLPEGTPILRGNLHILTSQAALTIRIAACATFRALKASLFSASVSPSSPQSQFFSCSARAAGAPRSWCLGLEAQEQSTFWLRKNEPNQHFGQFINMKKKLSGNLNIYIYIYIIYRYTVCRSLRISSAWIPTRKMGGFHLENLVFCFQFLFGGMFQDTLALNSSGQCWLKWGNHSTKTRRQELTPSDDEIRTSKL